MKNSDFKLKKIKEIYKLSVRSKEMSFKEFIELSILAKEL